MPVTRDVYAQKLTQVQNQLNSFQEFAQANITPGPAFDDLMRPLQARIAAVIQQADAKPADADLSAENESLAFLASDITAKLKEVMTSQRQYLAGIYRRLTQPPNTDEALSGAYTAFNRNFVLPADHPLKPAFDALKVALNALPDTPVADEPKTNARNALNLHLSSYLRLSADEFSARKNVLGISLQILHNAPTNEVRDQTKLLIEELLAPGSGVTPTSSLSAPLTALLTELNGLSDQAAINTAIANVERTMQQETQSQTDEKQATRDDKLVDLRLAMSKQPSPQNSTIIRLLNQLLEPETSGGLAARDRLIGPFTQWRTSLSALPENQPFDINTDAARNVIAALQPRLSETQREHIAVIQQIIATRPAGALHALHVNSIQPALDGLLHSRDAIPDTHPLHESLQRLQTALGTPPPNYDEAINQALPLVEAAANNALEFQPLSRDTRIAQVVELSHMIHDMGPDDDLADTQGLVANLLAPGGLPLNDAYLRPAILNLQKALANPGLTDDEKDDVLEKIDSAFENVGNITQNVYKNFRSYHAIIIQLERDIRIAFNSSSDFGKLGKLQTELENYKRQLQLYVDFGVEGSNPKIMQVVSDIKNKIRTDFLPRIATLEETLASPRDAEPTQIVHFSNDSFVYQGATAETESMQKVKDLLADPAAAPGAPTPAGSMSLAASVKTTPTFTARVNLLTMQSSDGTVHKMISRQVVKNNNVPASEFYFTQPDIKGSRTIGLGYTLPDDRFLLWAQTEIDNFIHKVTESQRKQGIDIVGGLSKDRAEAMMLLCQHRGILAHNLTGRNIEITPRQISHVEERLNKMLAKNTVGMPADQKPTDRSKDSLAKLREEVAEPRRPGRGR